MITFSAYLPVCILRKNFGENIFKIITLTPRSKRFNPKKGFRTLKNGGKSSNDDGDDGDWSIEFYVPGHAKGGNQPDL
jgi:hypothetical protein